MRTPRSLRFVPSPALALLFLATAASGQEMTRISVDSAGNEVNGPSNGGMIAANGRFASFQSTATNLVAGDTHTYQDVFLRDLQAGLTTCVSVDASGNPANGWSWNSAISPDGRYVAFYSAATNLVAVDKNGWWDVFLYDATTGHIELVSVEPSGVQGNGYSTAPAISADGTIVAFQSDASNFVSGDTNKVYDIFVRDLVANTIERISVDSNGIEANGESDTPAISADGRWVSYVSFASNLVPGDTNGVGDVFRFDRVTKITEMVSVDPSGAPGNGSCLSPTMSWDGRYVGFASAASNLIATDTNGFWDFFVRDCDASITVCESVDSAGNQGNGDCYGGKLYGIEPAQTTDDLAVAFWSFANNLVPVDTNGFDDVFFRQVLSVGTQLISATSGGVPGNGASYAPSISSTGNGILFTSLASDLIPLDTNGWEDVYCFNRCHADWENYGDGFKGTYGVPEMKAETRPVLGTTCSIDLENSYGLDTIAMIFVGFQRAHISVGKGRYVLVDPAFWVFVDVGFNGITLDVDIPDDESLCDLTVDLQALEVDPGAIGRLSFTEGLELVLGR